MTGGLVYYAGSVCTIPQYVTLAEVRVRIVPSATVSS